MKPAQVKTPKLPRHEARSEAVARYARARLLAHPDLVLKALRQKPATPHPDFRTNPPLSGE